MLKYLFIFVSPVSSATAPKTLGVRGHPGRHQGAKVLAILQSDRLGRHRHHSLHPGQIRGLQCDALWIRVGEESRESDRSEEARAFASRCHGGNLRGGKESKNSEENDFFSALNIFFSVLLFRVAFE